MHHQGFTDVRADPHYRVQRRHRFLEHEPDAGAAHLPHLVFGKAEQVPALEHDPASGDAPGFLHQANDRKRRHRLAAA